ncbi:acyl-CoA hydrolase [Alkalibaculum bacchi]|uniref:Acyl-CoA hydrolase n=1 Tax=Alkalibaculum bacchi TaxID=645887 RepID=A0A366HYD4_9FIRM|nr:acyl-CoA thioesterase [Alkalibaculum bacchi]RBP58215.1 acyl-CoA hydrolase [Alkalibaculum bacchi]
MKKEISFTRVETSMIMEPKHCNPSGNIHGGEMMKIMDNVAGIVAVKHAKGNVVTARVDETIFHIPVHVGDIVTCIGELAYVGTTSMQIFVSVLVNDIKGQNKSKIALTAFFTMVHLDEDGKPAKVPQLTPITPDEEALYLLGKKKYEEIKSKK